jgi:hypothetical protein
MLCKDKELRIKMGLEARNRVENRNWNSAFRQFWNGTL